MDKKFIRILQVTDPHFFANKEGTLLSLNTFKSFSAVLQLLEHFSEQHTPELIVLTGDLSQDYSVQSYLLLADCLKNSTVKIAWIPGNHDDPTIMQNTLAQTQLLPAKHFLLQKWQVILLNSQQPGEVAGLLAKDQLDFLKNNLSHYQHHTVVMLHHHVLPLGVTWLDRLNLVNSAEFLQLIDQYPQVKSVICGHVHQASSQSRNGVLFLSTPSTCIQFRPNSDRFALDSVMPGFRVIDLYDDGMIKTSVQRVAYDPQLLPDMSSTGY